MKSFKKLISLATMAALLAVVPGFSALRAEAATPTTYYLRFDEDKAQWRMQVGQWDDEYEGREAYYLNNGSEAVKDGDIIVVLASDEEISGHEDITVNAHLSNLTVNRTGIVIKTNGIDECYVLGGSYASISGNITNAYVYDDARCTFNNNVGNLRLISSQKNTVDVSVSVVGTVGYASTSNPAGIIDEYSNFAANTFYFDTVSGLMTDEQYYTKKGSPVSGPAATTTTTATTTAPANTAASTGNSNDYDDVPKTGDSSLAIWLLGLSALSFAGCLALRKSANK